MSLTAFCRDIFQIVETRDFCALSSVTGDIRQVNSVNRSVDTPLMLSARIGDVAMAKMLLEAGADVGVSNKGFTVKEQLESYLRRTGDSKRVPSLGARVIASDVIMIGSFPQNETNEVMLVEDVVCGEGVENGDAAIKVVFCRGSPFPSVPDICRTLQGKKCLVMGKLDQGRIYLQHGLSSVLPICNGTRRLNDICDRRTVVENLLKYKQKFIKGPDADDLINSLLQDLNSATGRISVFAFLSEDVGLWKGKDDLRSDIGCVVGAQLFKLKAFDDESIRFVSTGMPSISLSLKLRYLHTASLNGHGSLDLCEKMLLSLLKTIGHGSGDSSFSVIDNSVKRCMAGDMRKGMRILQSGSGVVRRCASEMLSLISGRSNPETANHEDEVSYWSRIIEELNTASPGQTTVRDGLRGF